MRYRKICYIILIFLLSSCNLPTPQHSIASSGKVYTWIDAPLNGARLPLSPYEIVLHSNAASGIKNVTLFINDELLATFPISEPATFMTTIKQIWLPLQPGIYKIHAQVQDVNGETAEGEGVQVEILNAESNQVVFTPTLTPAATLILTPSATATPSLLLTSVLANPTQVYIGNCGINQVQFTAQVSNQEQIKNLVLYIKLQEVNGTRYTDWNNGYLMKISNASGNFSYNLQTITIPENTQFKQAYLIYQFIGLDASGKVIDRSPVYGDVHVTQCNLKWPILTLNPGFPPVLILPTITPTVGIK